MTSMSGDAIFRNFRDAVGTGSWQEGQQAADHMAREMSRLAVDIKRLQDKLGAAWQGSAADAATRAVDPLAVEYINSSDFLSSSQDLLSRQVASFATAANSVQPVPPKPTTVDVVGAVLGAPTMEQRTLDYLNASQHNVDVYNAYYGASQYNTTNMPTTFGRITTDGATVTATPPTATLARGGPPTARPSAAHRSAAPHGGSARSGGAPSGRPTSGSVQAGLAPGTIAGQGNSLPQTPSAPRPSRGTSVSAAQPVAGSPDGGVPGDGPRSGGPMPGSAAGGSAASGSAGAGSAGAGAAGLAGPLGRVSGAPPAAPRSAVRARGGTGGETVAEGGARGVAGARGAAGEPVVAPSGRGGRRGEDSEHRAPEYLTEPDPEELFGISTRVAPPVIGE
jgi:hypothetical protein